MHIARDPFHCRRENLDVGNAHNLDVAELAECPTRVVIHALLRIARTPVLIIKQRIGDAAVWLVHAHNVAACRKSARFGFC